jgi:hypothetical protein
MDVTQIPCAHCGVVNEVVTRRSQGDYTPLCTNCRNPLREHRRVEFVADQGGLTLHSTPGKGLGVYTLIDIPKGALVERCPAFVIDTGALDEILVMARIKLLPNSDSALGPSLSNLVFPWFDDKRVLLMGYAMLYNHEPLAKSNLRWRPYVDPDTSRRYMDFYAKGDIAENTELTHTYNTTAKLWFSYKGGA